MKKIFLITMLAAGGAWAIGQLGFSKVTTVSLANITTEPTSATGGLPVELNGAELRRLIVTAKQPDDAGAESQDLNAVALRAWKYTIQGTLSDAGTLFRWSRIPELDMVYSSDAGTGAAGYATHNNGLSMTVAVPLMGNADRLTYTAHGPGETDGGTPFVDLVIEGRYVDPSHP